ncbi:hypothetical protein RHMOL_RhmolMtG0011400 (mitochondrion) [Rhododendron molle]|nr:hypothetical protein RHMOL_RhmolMtG0010000 [Rhododendron molle]KAI8522376.1 hypothetical protein RHMOL_RhmolMtG0011400 [Rhododendron molle]
MIEQSKCVCRDYELPVRLSLGRYARGREQVQKSKSAEPTSSAEQPQGLPAVIAELTRWVALELTLKSEINVGSRLSEKHRLKRRITKCKTTRGEPSACAKEEANQSEWRQGGEAKERFSSLQAASNNG